MLTQLRTGAHKLLDLAGVITIAMMLVQILIVIFRYGFAMGVHVVANETGHHKDCEQAQKATITRSARWRLSHCHLRDAMGEIPRLLRQCFKGKS